MSTHNPSDGPSRASLLAFIANAPAAVSFLYGPDHVYELANPACAGLAGNRPLIGRPAREVFPEIAEQGFLKVLDDVYATGEPFVGNELPLRLDDAAGGRDLYLTFVCQPLRDEAGAVTAVACHATDVTALVEARAAAQASEAHFRLLFDAMPQLGWTARADGYIDFYNRGWYAFTGTTPAEMEGWGWQSVHDPSTLDAVLARWRASIATGQPFEMEFPLRRYDGVFRWFLTRISPVLGDDGRVVRWVGVNTDVDDIRAARALATAVTEQSLETEQVIRRLSDRIIELETARRQPPGTDG